MFGSERAYREKPAYGIIKRLRRKLLSILNLWHREGYDVRYVFINQKRYKKIVFPSEARAQRVCADQKAFGASRHFPTVVGQRGDTLWVEFVQGRLMGQVDIPILPLVADFYTAVYRREPRLAALREAAIWDDFLRDLNFLHDVKLLSDRCYRELIDHSDEIAPAMAWFGFDYTDPSTENLVVRENKDILCAIDIKNLYSGALIGGGVAKARTRWLSDALTEPFVEQLSLKGAPDFRNCLPFLEILGQVTRAKNIVLKGVKSLQPGELDQHLERLIPQARATCRAQAQPAVEPLAGVGARAGIDDTTRRPAQRP
ncbi:MAG: hypothetical protein L0H73_09875 [Nitrococcus sp.]|nr:hypothetical protein [Nitrococcus sp.]